MAVRKQKAKASPDAHEMIKIAQALSTRLKHAKNKTGFKVKSGAYLNQVPILRDKSVIYTIPQPGGNHYYRTWIPEEKRYYLKSLRTNDLDQAICTRFEREQSHGSQGVWCFV
jgi:homospermidine synthase